MTRGDAPSVRISGVTRGDDGFQARGSWHSQILEVPTTEPERQVISCYWRKAHFDGRHLIFTSCECNRSASVLYARSSDRIWFFSAANAPALPISRQWTTNETARRVVSRSCVLGSNGARAVPCRSNREVCMSGRTSVSWGCLPITSRWIRFEK